METEVTDNDMVMSVLSNVNEEVNKLEKGAAETVQLDNTMENFPMNIQSKEILVSNEDNSIIMNNSFSAAVGKEKVDTAINVLSLVFLIVIIINCRRLEPHRCIRG